MRGTRAALLLSVCLLATPAGATAAEDLIDFATQIRPILSDNCFACHGPDDKPRKARLRLDTREGLLGELRGGGRAVVPGKPGESVLVERITATEPDFRMPPPESNKSLTPEQVELVRKWVEQGANWSAHWAFVAPTLPEPPEVSDPSWARNPIDRFVRARLDRAGLKPAPEADRATLIRRVYLDLTGLPPTPAEVDAFLKDDSPDAYEKVVDRLLASPRFGEHMGRYWLDAARYGDTHGLHLDNYREMWPYREWVLNAFNANKPFDRFLVEQVAGDLLPDPTRDQLIATGFLRCHVTTNEGGSIAEECYVRNVVDRVDTNGVVLLGLTLGCARCHDHKYDPVSQKEYYQLFAFFNNLDGNPMDGNAAQHPPVVKVPTPEQERALAGLDRQLAAARRKLKEAAAKVEYDDRLDEGKSEKPERAEFVWIDDELPAGAKPGGDGPWEFVGGPDSPVLSGAKSHRRKAPSQSQHYFTGANPPLRVGAGDVLFAYVYIDPADPPREIMLQWNSGDWKHRAYWGENLVAFGRDGTTERVRLGELPGAGEWVRLEVPARKVGLKPGTQVNGWAFTQFGGTVYWDKAGVVTQTPQGGAAFDTLTAWLSAQRAAPDPDLPAHIRDAVKLDPAKRSEAQKRELKEYFIENAYAKARPVLAPLRKELDELEKRRKALDDSIPTTLVFKERAEPKPAHLLNRGEYDQKREEVGRAVPAFLPPLPEGAPLNRLGFAQWLVHPSQPLTARVAVNRFWQQCFGTGIVKTSEDFGIQGEPPSHPQLLDWLAVRFREDGWDVKRLMRLLVTSAAYRQSAAATPEKLAKDPENRLLSRGPRFRLDAEQIRDQALFVSGLLVERLGGPSVKPPQPPGLWEAVGYTRSNTANFVPDTGHEKVHRRSLYTFWKRTAPPPEMYGLDAPSREACTVRRERTNTPLQALMLLNDPQFVEAARALAERALREGGSTPEDRAAYMFRLATARPPEPAELRELVAAFSELRASYRKEIESARELIKVGELPPDPAFPPDELAAWTMVANVILNLDEVLNKG